MALTRPQGQALSIHVQSEGQYHATIIDQIKTGTLLDYMLMTEHIHAPINVIIPSVVLRPPDIIVGGLIFYQGFFLSSFFFLFFAL